MKLFNAKLNRAALIEALNLFKTPTCYIIQARMQHDVLKCVRLVADNGTVTVTGTDLDCTVAIQLPAETQGSGAVILNCDALRDAIKGMDGEHLDIADTGGKRARVSADTGNTLIPVHTNDDWPIESNLWFTTFETRPVVSKAFVHDLARVRAAISTEETRYYLNGAYFHIVDGKLRIAATDGHRLSLIERTAPEGFEDQPDVIVPRNAIEWMKRNAVKLGEQVSIGWTASQFILKAGNVRFCTKNIDGTFPDISRVIPSQSDNPITFDADATAKAAKGATAHCTRKTRAVAFSVGEGFHTLVGHDPEAGRSSAFVSGTEYSGADYVAGFNAGYLGELLATFKGQRVTMQQQDAACPALFTSDDSPELTVVLMPMRLDSDAVYSPEELAKADRDAIQTFEAEAGKVIEAIAVCEENDLPCDGKKRELGEMTGAAIDLYAAREGVERYEARRVILTQLAGMGYGTAPAERRKAAPDTSDISGNTDSADDSADHIADTGQMVADNPLYDNLQQFKAQAGVGARWQLENWSYDNQDWGEPRIRIVATVKARELGFVDDGATQADIDAANAKGRADGRSWWTFPRQGEWSATESALVTYYPDGSPKMRLTPMPLEIQQDLDDPIAALAAQVAALAETVGATSASDAQVQTAQPDQSDEVERLKAEVASLTQQVVEARTGEREAQEQLEAAQSELCDARAERTRVLLANTEVTERADKAERELAELSVQVVQKATRDENGPVIERKPSNPPALREVTYPAQTA